MSDVFAPFLAALKVREGGATYTNRPADRGGPTKWGITAETLGRWRRLGRDATPAEVQALEEAEADRIYRCEYFIRPGFECVATISPCIAEELIDTGVNMGTDLSRRLLQRTLNLLNRRERDFADVTVDGKLGPLTLAALRALVARRGQRAAEDLVLKCLNGLQLARYVAIAEGGGPNNDQEENFVGWVTQRVGMPA